MAPKDKHNPAYKGLDAMTLRGIDGTAAGLKSIWTHMSLRKDTTAGLCLAATLGLGTGVTTMFEYYSQDGINTSPSVGLDHDVAGKALFNRTHNNYKHEDVWYLLLNDDGRYELYQYRDQAETLIPAPDIAQDILEEVIEDIEDRNDVTDITMRCETINNAFAPEDGGILRYSKGCKKTSPDDADEEAELKQETLAFWQTAFDNMNANNYGPLAENITPAIAPDAQPHESFTNIFAENAAFGFGAWLALGMAGAGVSGLRRRVEKKTQKHTPR